MKRLILALLLVLWSTAASAAVTVNTANAGGHNTTGFNLSIGAGSNRYAVCMAYTYNDDPTGMSIGGNAMTVVTQYAFSFDAQAVVSVYYLLAPPTGTQAVTIAGTTSGATEGIDCVVYNDVPQNAPEAFGTASVAVANLVLSVTTLTADAYLVGLVSGYNLGNVLTAGTGATYRIDDGNAGTVGDSNNASGGAGSRSMTFVNAGSAGFGVLISIATSGGGGGSSGCRQLLLVGVGGGCS